MGSLALRPLRLSAVTAILLAEVNPRAGQLGAAYAAALAIALVYCREYYVIDLIIGAALSLSINAAASLIPRAPAHP
jgi:hypothetical protein